MCGGGEKHSNDKRLKVVILWGLNFFWGGGKRLTPGSCGAFTHKIFSKNFAGPEKATPMTKAKKFIIKFCGAQKTQR